MSVTLVCASFLMVIYVCVIIDGDELEVVQLLRSCSYKTFEKQCSLVVNVACFGAPPFLSYDRQSSYLIGYVPYLEILSHLHHARLLANHVFYSPFGQPRAEGGVNSAVFLNNCINIHLKG